MRTANLLMSILFLFSAAVQVNDPDPLAWIAIYAAAATVCAWLAVAAPPGRWARALPLAVSIVAVAWAGVIAARSSGHVPPLRLFESWEMTDTRVEEDREMYGLLIVGAWMLIAGARPPVRAARSAPVR